MIQEFGDDFREWRVGRNQEAAKRRVARRDFWRREIGTPWTDLVPGWLPWAGLAVFWAVLAWLVFW